MAGEEGRCFVTRNARGFIPLTRRFQEDQLPHAGLLIVPRSLANDNFAGIAAALIAYAESHEGGIASYRRLSPGAPTPLTTG